MQHKKVEAFNLIGIAIQTTNEENKSAQDIANLWGKFMSENVLNQIPEKVDDTIYSLYTNYEGDHAKPYTTIIGCKVKSLNNIPEGLVGQHFSGGNYAKTTAKGDLTKGLIVNTWQTIWEEDLDRAYTADFEVFDHRARNPADSEIDFYVAVK